jgi:hypothetical protein
VLAELDADPPGLAFIMGLPLQRRWLPLALQKKK